MTYAITNSDQYPATLSDAGVSDGSATYQYRVDNTANPKTFCITATTQNIAYFESNTVTSPTAGVCPGHAAPGQTLVTNQFRNPAFDGPSQPEAQGGATAAIATYNGSAAARGVATGPAYASIRLHPAQDRWLIGAGQTVFALAKICNAAPAMRESVVVLRYYDTGGSTLGTQLATDSSTPAIIPSSACQNVSLQGTAPTGTQSVGVSVNRDGNNGSVAGDTFYVDNVLLSDRSTGFASGDSSGWIWNGEANNSTSTGPAL
jgi:hypothetical protein